MSRLGGDTVTGGTVVLQGTNRVSRLEIQLLVELWFSEEHTG